MKECGWQEKRIDIGGNGCQCEIQADFVVPEKRYVKIWGRVLNCFAEVVQHALLKLVKVVCDGQGRYVYEKIAHTITDCNGYYEFELCIEDCQTEYKVLIEKSLIQGGCSNNGFRNINRPVCEKRNSCDCGAYDDRNFDRYEREYEVYDIDIGQMHCREEKPCNPCQTSYSMMKQETSCQCQPMHTTRHMNGTVHAPNRVKF